MCIISLSLSLFYYSFTFIFVVVAALGFVLPKRSGDRRENGASSFFFFRREIIDRERERENKNADDPIIRRRTKKEIHTESMPAVSETGPAANEKVADSVWDQENRRDFVPTTLETRYQLGGQLERHRRFRRPDFLEEKKLSKTR